MIHELPCSYFRGLFIIDDKGNLRQITINDLPVGRSVDETLRLVQAFQFTDKHGEGLYSACKSQEILLFWLETLELFKRGKLHNSCFNICYEVGDSCPFR